MAKTDVDKMLEKNQNLIHSNNQKVISHTQREKDDWFINSVMVEGCDVPFKYKRKKLYKSLKGARVNMTYYIDKESVAGLDFEVMRVVRIRQS
ncbi:hypothetical protein HR060_02175 [Catenovulum sp. SM1970]|uniref:hypothetical protein n=1 Tax=Marinifaba aquimaris TaxID=2741323 RepID=UPI0015731C1B|nr:hypothetical protein [Marinifaba aquimaris]NTS75662.1 hypothetical protein [Marinifaba aquimaris]